MVVSDMAGCMIIGCSEIIGRVSKNNGMTTNMLTTLVAVLITVIGYVVPNGDIIFSIGVFACSGAITNWLAIHMLFYRVPGLYGSGVIPRNFQAFRDAIRHLLLQEFFTTDNIKRLVADSVATLSIDVDVTFERLCDAIVASPMGNMLAMVGGRSALEPLKPNVTATLEELIQEISDGFDNAYAINDLKDKSEQIIEMRLAELTPETVRDILQQMIAKHLGWLVIWGGVFGGALGLIFGLYRFGIPA